MNKTVPKQTACIAVLPFENFTGGRQNDYFSIGFVEEIITDLARFPNLQVISSYTSRKIGVDDRDEMDVAGELEIDYLLKGNLLQQGSLLRIYTQLIQVPHGSVVGAERYDAPKDVIFDIQDDIVERVVGAVSAQINWVLLSAARNKPLTSLTAYDSGCAGWSSSPKRSAWGTRSGKPIYLQSGPGPL